MKIIMPGLGDIPSYEILKEKKDGRSEQRVGHMASKCVGRVPANICKLFHKLLETGEVNKVTAFATGPPTISKSVQAAQAYEKSKFDKEGSLWWRCKSFPVYRWALFLHYLFAGCILLVLI